MRYLCTVCLLAVLHFTAGCAQHRIACHSPKHAATLTEIEEQQVLDNIAMFVSNVGSTPYFALPNGGGTLTNQSATVGGGLIWTPTTLLSESGNLSGTGGLTINWTFKPIVEPERLNLMKCVYWHVTQKCPVDDCNDCQTKLSNFFGTDFACCDVPSGWFTVSNKKPKRDDCSCKVGHHCGTYICVNQRHWHYLSQVTVSILDIATVDEKALAFRVKGSKKVVEVEETFEVVSGNTRRTVKGKVDKPLELYNFEKNNGTVPEPGNKLELFDSTPEIRQRRDSGSSFESLLQLNNAR